MQHLKYWVWLSNMGGVGAVTALKLLNHFGDAEKVFFADEKQYRQIQDVRPSDIPALMNKNLDRANTILADCEKLGCHVLTLFDEEYPERLRNIYNPPVIIYIKGNLPTIDSEPIVGVVGTRNCTAYGQGAAESISYKLACSGIIVATGLAKGIDSAAARGALRARRHGHIIGVIGSGHGIVYPPENADLFDDVENYGAIISEYPPYTPAAKKHFPARNRIISGISIGLAVIEAPKRSGALITAAMALEQDRDVFTLPGNVDEKSCEGSNLLLRDGAIAILSAEDIISEYMELFPSKIKIDAVENKPNAEPVNMFGKPGLQASSYKIKSRENKKEIDNTTQVEYIDVEEIIGALDGDERIVAQIISSERMHIDDIILKAELEAARVLAAITLLEIKGSIFSSSGKVYSLLP